MGNEEERLGEAEAKTGAAAGPATSKDFGLQSIDFATFILSLSTTALYQMGLVPDPISGKTHEPDSVLARQTIDTLEMLQAKTRGNLDLEEANLLESLLAELRLHFVEIDR